MLLRVVLVLLLAADPLDVAMAEGADGDAAPQSHMSEEEIQRIRETTKSRSDHANRQLKAVIGTSPQDILIPPSAPHGDAGALAGVDPELRRNLARQIEAAQQRLEEARRRLGASSQDGTLALSQQLLDTIRTHLSGDAAGDTEAMENQIAAALAHAQPRIDMLRASVAGSPDAERQNEALDRMQQQLDLARQRLSGADSRPPDGEQVAALFARAQRKLDEARERARALPDSAKLLRRVDAAQQRLDEARGDLDLLPASGN